MIALQEPQYLSPAVTTVGLLQSHPAAPCPWLWKK